jgi:hypothetical protein
METKGQQILRNILKEYAPDQAFTIEELTRKYLQEQGYGWQGYREVETYSFVEDFLKEQGLIKEYDKTTLYRITDKVKEQ